MKKILLLFVIISTAVTGFATTVERLTLDDMIHKAHAIVHGKVLSSSTHWSADHKLILTTTTIEVHETIKGQATRTIELTTIGGRIGDLTLVVPGMPAFEAGEDALVFVENVGSFKTVVGLSQGKFLCTQRRSVERNNSPENAARRLQTANPQSPAVVPVTP